MKVQRVYTYLAILFARPGDEWLVECEADPEIGIIFRADVGPNPNLPPETGWEFLTYDQQSYKVRFVKDPDLKCSALPPKSSTCMVNISFSGEASSASGLQECAGLYTPTKTMSMGRRVETCLFSPGILFNHFTGIRNRGKGAVKALPHG